MKEDSCEIESLGSGTSRYARVDIDLIDSETRLLGLQIQFTNSLFVQLPGFTKNDIEKVVALMTRSVSSDELQELEIKINMGVFHIVGFDRKTSIGLLGNDGSFPEIFRFELNRDESVDFLDALKMAYSQLV